jgi:hypothetical protein
MDQVIEGMLKIIQGLEPRKRRKFFRELLNSGMLSKDEQDILVIESRRDGPARPLEQVARNMRGKSAQK